MLRTRMFSKTLTIAGALVVASLFTGCDEVLISETSYYEPARYPRTEVYVVEERGKKKHYDRRRHRDYRRTEVIVVEKEKKRKNDRWEKKYDRWEKKYDKKKDKKDSKKKDKKKDRR